MNKISGDVPKNRIIYNYNIFPYQIVMEEVKINNVCEMQILCKPLNNFKIENEKKRNSIGINK